MRSVAAAVIALTILAGTAAAKDEPFGQETVEVRAFRNKPPPPRPARSHRGHSHDGKRPANAARRHSHGRGDRSHAHAHQGHRGHSHRGGKVHAHAHGGGAARHPHGAHDGHAHGPGGSHDHGIETEHLFGFTVGSDIGLSGHKHLIVTNDLGIGKRAGSYVAGEHSVEYAFTPWKDFHVGFSGGLASHQIAGVPGLNDRRQLAFDHFAIDLRQRLLDRKTSPFGLTFIVEPHWGRIDEASGERVKKTEVEFTLAADKDVVADRLFVAFNAFYGLEYARSLASGEVERSSIAGVSFAVMQRVLPQLFAGAELRYARAYDGLRLDRFAGDAVFLGPMFYTKLTPDLALVAAWSAQIAGHAVGAPGALDLDHFDRHRARLKLVVDF